MVWRSFGVLPLSSDTISRASTFYQELRNFTTTAAKNTISIISAILYLIIANPNSFLSNAELLSPHKVHRYVMSSLTP